ncbi:MAG: antibiotic biosynthesis monooxygenase [Caulobacterales bacterium]|jgi:quinol monooxygenase YgiN|nr:antibiotic biosynthesis monooxygenase [Caulobacterales bacterium]
MIGVVATMKVKPDQVAAFEDAMRDLVRATRANEPGVTVYHFCRSQKEPTTYIVMEMYADQATLDAHMGSEWFRGASPKLGPCLAERPLLEKFDPLEP